MIPEDKLQQILNAQIQQNQLLNYLCLQQQSQTRVMQEQYYAALLASTRYADPKRLARYEHQVFSQNGEDGIIDEIFRRIGTGERYFVEVGVGNGLQNNTAYLLWRNWSGLWVDGNHAQLQQAQQHFKEVIDAGRLRIVASMVSGRNIAELLGRVSIPSEFDLLSLDIDRNTWFLWQALKGLRPRVVIVEYNSTVPPSHEWCVTDVPDAIWNGSHYFGASLKAFEQLGTQLGYSLVGCDTVGANAFFVRNDLVGEHFASPFTAENHYEPPRYYLVRQAGHPPKFSDAPDRR
jgi:hypothetical protein